MQSCKSGFLVRLVGVCLLFLLLGSSLLSVYSNTVVVDDDGVSVSDKEYAAELIQFVKTLEDQSFPCKIEEGLYLGSFAAASDKTALKNLNITHVLTVANMLPRLHPNDFIYKTIEVYDSSEVKLSEYFDECFKFIEEARANGGAVMIHCLAGISRSASVTIAYMMTKHGMNLNEAFEHVWERRPVIHSNSGFIQQLKKYEKYLQGRRYEL